MPDIQELRIADEPAAWAALGFDVEGDVCRVSAVRLRLAGKGERRGILGWSLAEADAGAGSGHAEAAGPHPNGVVSIDHVVMLTPDLDRTVEELRAEGFDLRRIRSGPVRAGPPPPARREEATRGDSPRQAFFRAGEPILEVVLAPAGSSVARDPDGPARLWGISFLTRDMDVTQRALGELLGRPRDAVQPGRTIATLRAEAGLGPAIAFMTP